MTLDISGGILIPMVVDLCKGHKSPLTGKQVPVVAAGGIAVPALVDRER